MEDRSNFKNRDNARLVGGLILVAGGAALLMRNFGYLDLPYWLFTWPMIVILAGVYSGIKHNFSNSGWIIMIAVGGFFLVNKIDPGIRLEPAFWPAVIIGVGIMFLVRPQKKNHRRDRFNYGNAEPQQLNADKEYKDYKISPPSSSERSDYLKVDSVFSGVNKTILSKNFQGGRISCVFGGAEIDLLQADINGTIMLKMDVVFGGAKLLIPSNWTLHNEIDGAFQSVEDKRKYNPGVMVDPNKVLILKGSVVFGGIEIKSY